MVRAKNYETVSTCVKAMQKKLWPLFFRTRCSLMDNREHSAKIVKSRCHVELRHHFSHSELSTNGTVGVNVWIKVLLSRS